MKVRNNVIYQVTTAIIVIVMSFSLYKMFGPLWQHLGFPTFLRTELVVAKVLGLIALLVPGVPARIKEWAYAGFGIVLVSASVAHASCGDPVLNVLEPLGFLCILLVSNWSWHRRAA